MAKRKPADAPFRIEHDSMGELQVPAAALWGAQTQRARDNFDISGRPMPNPVATRSAASPRDVVQWAGNVGFTSRQPIVVCTIPPRDEPKSPTKPGAHDEFAKSWTPERWPRPYIASM